MVIRQSVESHPDETLRLLVSPVPKGLTVRLAGLSPTAKVQASVAGADKVVKVAITFGPATTTSSFHLSGEIVAPEGADPRLLAGLGRTAVDPILVNVVYECPMDSPNVAAFMHLIRLAEHYPTDDDAKAYSTMFGGGVFKDDSTHPNRTGTTAWGQHSTAAGAYQILYGTWLQAVNNGIVSDFKPVSQDTVAYNQIKARNALDAVCKGDLDKAYSLLRNEWTSLPGAKQSRFPGAAAKAAFVKFGGTPAAPARGQP